MVETKSTDQEKDLIVNIYHVDSYEINVVTCKMTYNIYIYIFMMIYKYISNTMYMYVRYYSNTGVSTFVYLGNKQRYLVSVAL